MKTILTTLFIGCSIFAFTQSSSIHPDCQKESAADQKICTEEKISNYIKEYLISEVAWSEAAAPITGTVHLNISDQGLIELDETHLSASTSQIKLIREAITRFSYRHLFLPAKDNGVATFEYKVIPITIGEVDANSIASPITHSSNTQPSTIHSGEVFKVVEEMPRFPGCEDVEGDDNAKKSCADKAMLQFIYSNIKYPVLARQSQVQGTIVIQFVVEKNGMISNIKCTRDIGAECGQEGVRVVKMMNVMPERWIPGKQKGKPVRVQFNLPIKFRLG